MKKNIILIGSSILFGVLFTFLILNKENIYAKEEYIVYAFQSGEHKNYDNASKDNSIPSIIIYENNLYKVYNAIYKDIDLINTMLDYFNNKKINIYLKQIKVNKSFYNALDQYENIVKKINNSNNYDQINKSILNLYLESIGV